MLTVDPFYDIRALTANARLLFGKVLADDMRKRLLRDSVTLMLKLEKAYRERRSKRKLESTLSLKCVKLPYFIHNDMVYQRDSNNVSRMLQSLC